MMKHNQLQGMFAIGFVLARHPLGWYVSLTMGRHHFVWGSFE